MAKSKSAKKVKVKRTPATKTPRVPPNNPDVTKHEPITWGLKYAELAGDHGWHTLHAEYLRIVHRELVRMEGQTLHALLRSEHLKDISAEHLRPKPRGRLTALKLEEEDTFWELRLPNKWRAWGVVRGSTFYFLWWDEKETVCNPPRKGERRR